MKRMLSIFLSITLILCLSACSSEPPAVNTEFAGDFCVTQNGTDYAGSLSLNADGLAITMSEPYTVKDIAFLFDSEGLHINYAGYGTIANCDYIPAQAVPVVLHNALSYMAQAEYLSTEDGEDSFRLPTPYGSAVIKAHDGVPTELYDEHSGLTFVFTDQ